MGRSVYNPLNKLVRRIKAKMMRLRRDILLIVLAIILAAFGTVLPTIGRDWTIVPTVSYFVILAVLIFAVVVVVRGIRTIDIKEDARQKNETKQLIKDTVKETLEALSEENTKVKGKD